MHSINESKRLARAKLWCIEHNCYNYCEIVGYFSEHSMTMFSFITQQGPCAALNLWCAFKPGGVPFDDMDDLEISIRFATEWFLQSVLRGIPAKEKLESLEDCYDLPDRLSPYEIIPHGLFDDPDPKDMRGKTVKDLTTGKTYRSLGACAADTGLNKQNISKVCHGVFSQTGGHKFAFVQKQEDGHEQTD